MRGEGAGREGGQVASFSVIHGDAFALMRGLVDGSADVAILDPPYSARQHAGVRSARRNTRITEGKACRTRRVVDLGFDHFERRQCQIVCHELARLVLRWTLVFCDDDLLPIWRACARKAGLDVVRTGVWVREGGAPQFTGDRPGGGVEYIVILHPKGRKRWNGGGSPGVWIHPIVANRSGHRKDRMHTTQKPEALLCDLVTLFTEPGEMVFDPFAGSGTTGVAALRYGRRFLGLEQDEAYAGIARERCEAEAEGTTLVAARIRQMTIWERTHAGD